MDRRTFLGGTVAAIPSALALQMLGGRWVFAQTSDFKNPVDVLNFALTLEFLEATFYQQGTAKNLVSGAEAALLERIQADEETHVKVLSDTIKQIGGSPVKAPKVDFGGAFKDRASFLKLAHTFENTGVQAYLGAAPSLFKEKQLLSAAASIFGVEARHAAVLGDILGLEAEGGVFKGANEATATKGEVLKAVKPFIKG